MGLFKSAENSKQKYLDLLKRDPSGRLFIQELLCQTLTMAYENYNIPKRELIDMALTWSHTVK